MKVRVKICGVTDAAGAGLAVDAGADCLGFVFARSERQVDLEGARAAAAGLPSGVGRVAVFRHPSPIEVERVMQAFAPSLVQSEPDPGVLEVVPSGSFLPVFHDSEDLVERVRHFREAFGDGLILLEGAGRGGRGTRADWDRAERAARLGPLALAGGLTPDNVGEAIGRVRPRAVDVSSGVERAPGVKAPDKVRGFLDAVRAAERERIVQGD